MIPGPTRIAFQDGAGVTRALDWPGKWLAFLAASDAAALARAMEGVEDRRDMAVGRVDALPDVLCARSTSGTIPYAPAAVAAVHAVGCLTICIADNPGASVLEAADLPVLIDAKPVPTAGSTRMMAGTIAQQIVLHLRSTTLTIRLGRVRRGYRVDMLATNKKLCRRAVRMPSELTGRPDSELAAGLATAGGKVKLPVLILRGVDHDGAAASLERCGGHLRTALAILGGTSGE